MRVVYIILTFITGVTFAHELNTPDELLFPKILEVKELYERTIKLAFQNDTTIHFEEFQRSIEGIDSPKTLAILFLYFRNLEYPNIDTPEETDDEAYLNQWDYVCSLNAYSDLAAQICLFNLKQRLKGIESVDTFIQRMVGSLNTHPEFR